MKISALINHIVDSLELSGNRDHNNRIAWWILESITCKSKLKLMFDAEFKLTDSQAKKLKDWLDKMNQNYPLQYLLGSVPFLNLKINVEAPVLIPRPETENWVSELIQKFLPLKDQNLFVLDIGCGTGCIGLALAKAFPNWNVIGVDISDKALELSIKNKKENQLQNINFLKSDLFECVPEKKFDLIVSNPPYISLDQYETLEGSVAKWEDKQALVAPFDGIALIHQIIDLSPEFLEKRFEGFPSLVVEIDSTQKERVSKLLQDSPFKKFEIAPDQFLRDRLAVAYF